MKGGVRPPWDCCKSIVPTSRLYSGRYAKKTAPDVFKKVKKLRDVEALKKRFVLKLPAIPRVVDIRTSTAGRRPFNILVDGELFWSGCHEGKIQKCEDMKHLPMSFFPPDM